MKRLVIVISILFVVGVAVAAAQKNMPHDMSSMHSKEMMMDCPMALPGTIVTASDTANGIALNITTETANVPELRRRVEHMVAMHKGGTSGDGMMNGSMPQAAISYEETQNGARLTLTPQDSANLAALRAKVRAHVEKMSKEGCAMMHDMMMSGPKNEGTDHSEHHSQHQ